MSDKFTYRWGYELLRALPVKSGVAVEIGDHLKISGGAVTPVTATTDNLAMVGIAKEAHPSTGKEAFSGQITVALRNAQAVYEPALDAATDITIGDAMQMEDGKAQSLKKSATDPIAVAVESKLQATSVKVIYTIPATTGGLNFIGEAS